MMCGRILVIGARGLVGAEVIARLAALGHSVVGLLHSNGPIKSNDGTPIPTEPFTGDWPAARVVGSVHGDIARPQLGLDGRIHQRLNTTADMIVHCAAITKFGLQPARYEMANVRGTENVLDFVTNGARRIPLVYVSTAYVCGEHAGVFREDDLDLGQQHGNPYEISKFQAECRVRKAMLLGHPATVLRPSIIVGHSRTGVMSKFDTIYTVVRVTAAGLVRTMPGDYGATLDLVPVDWVADAVVRAVANFDHARGLTMNLTAGAPTTLRDINDVSAEFPSFHIPRYVPQHVFDRTALGVLERRYYDDVIALYEPYLIRQVRFARDQAASIIGEAPRTVGKALLRKIFRYGIAAGYFVPRLT